eukprot:SAG31_NODE_2502_length_5594_cov_3.175796_9_plen_20_part_01
MLDKAARVDFGALWMHDTPM